VPWLVERPVVDAELPPDSELTDVERPLVLAVPRVTAVPVVSVSATERLCVIDPPAVEVSVVPLLVTVPLERPEPLPLPSEKTMSSPGMPRKLGSYVIPRELEFELLDVSMSAVLAVWP
jgi:hypothetical protein